MVAGNVTFPIYNSDGTSFNGLELKKSVYESVVMSLGDKITGDVYYPNNALVVTMKEYITYNGVKYVLVNPPTIVREGMVSDNGELKGMTKYSFTFYHPMYMLGNFPLCDVAVSSDQQRYLSENKTFFWIGNLTDFVAKLNKNLENTEWYCVINNSVSQADRQRLSEVMSFDKNTIADALKTGYETWDVPYIISIIPSTDPLYQQGKRFLIQYGLPSTEILVENAQHELVPFVFHFGQGVGLKNNSRTPRNNKIVTRIAGYGSEDNIQYGYPQIPYEGGDCQYPLYYGIVGGQRVQLIKHPFTRTHLMPSIYRETVNKKVNPMATGYDPTIELKDYYDADNTYENPIKPLEPSYEIHEFEKIKPELGQRSIVGVSAYSNKDLDSISLSSFISLLSEYYTESEYLKEKEELEKIINTIGTMSSNSGSVNTRAYYCDWSFTKDERYAYVKFESSALNFEYTVLMVSPSQDVEWDDTMDDDGNYVQSYFRITIPQLTFDLYASAAITQEMTINMRSGACLGCSFPVMVDWDDYKLNFYDADGNFAPSGSQRDYDKYPDSSQGQITLILQKETSTFGTLMPNIYQKPHAGDEFVILGISLPTSYITSAEARLDAEMKQYMRDNNVYYYDYPLKFDEHFLTTHAGILAQMDNNVIVRFDYAGTEHALYIKQVSVKYENKPLPTYDITLTDNIEVVLNQIGQVVDEVRRLHDNLGGVEIQPSNNYLRKDIDDTAYGMIRLIKGLQVGNRFVTGLLGEGGVFRKEEDGTTYLECDKMYVRMKAYFDTVEVRHYMHSVGNRVASNAGINCSRVEYIDSNGDVTQDASEATLFRCYFRANDDGREVRNDFVVGDLAFCRETNVNTDSVDQHGYWRAVIGRNANGVLTNDGEGWIDLSVNDCQEGSGIPIAQDDIVQLGNKTDTTRQGAIIEFVSGADAPSYQIYQGINTYSLNGKNYIGLGYSSQNARAYLNVYGDAYIGDPNESSYIRYNAGTRNLEIKAKISAQSTIDGETLAQFIAENTWTEEQIDALITAETDPLVDAIDEIRQQVDGSISTWFYDGVPTLQNLPASQWTTADDKNEHLGDLYYDNITGYGYRFKYDELNRQWSWGRITDVDVVKALADAAKAQDTADHKRRVFVVQPTPPYDAGDLWVNATYPSGNTETNEAHSKYYNDVLRCKTSKASGTTFAIADWSLASKYTDDQALEDFKANQYVTALTNGTINQNITNALNAANAAQQAADDAQADADAAATAAANAQTSATNANNRLDGWADDGKISPTEKTSLKLEWENVKKEYAQICNDADKYSVSKTAFASAYTSANSAFQKYTAATPENITIGTDYANIAAYYAARQTILDAITTAAKKVATDAQAKADSAYALAGSAEAAAQAAEAHAATLDYVKTALKQDTVIEGGLVLSTLIALRDGSNHIWSGISGTYQSAETGTGYKGHGIAAWYGGAMVDKEVTTTATDYAKSLFRFDGSGYVASGNLSWDKNGNVTIQGYSINATTLQVGGVGVLTTTAAANTYLSKTDAASTYLTKTDAANTYLSIAFFNRLFRAYNGSTQVSPNNTTSTIDNIKAMFGFWTQQYISALGNGSGGSSGGIDMTTVWTALGNATNEQINATHLSNVLVNYNPTSNFKTINGNSIIGTGDIAVGAAGDYLPLSGGTVTGYINAKHNFDLSKSDNGVSSTIWPTTFNILDSSNRISARLENVVKANGENGFFLYARQYDANGNMIKQEGLQYHLPKTGDGVWSIHNPSSFRTALGLGARATDNTDYLPLTGGTLTGAVALNGGLTPLDTGTVGTASGGGKVWFKRVNSTEAPNYGVVIEYGYSSTWTGQLYLGDNANQGLYWNGWYDGVRGEWKKIAFASELSSYLPLSGGTMSGSLTISTSSYATQLIIKRSNAYDAAIRYENSDGLLGTIGVSSDKYPYFTGDGSTIERMWTSGNDGSGSGLDADLLDGYDSTYFANRGTTWDKTVRQDGYILELRAGTQSTSDNPFSIIGGNAATVIQNLPEAQDYGAQLAFGFGSARVVYRNRNNSSSNSDWVGIIAGSADKLVTSRTIWGQSFDGTANISGNISSVGDIIGTAGINMITTGDSSEFRVKLNNVDAASYAFTKTFFGCFGAGAGKLDLGRDIARWNVLYTININASGNSSIGGTLGVTGAATLSSTLGVTGLLTASGGINIPSGKTLTIGDAVLSWDSTNQGIKITKGLYSQTFISALGQGSSGESGVNMNTVWTALGNNTNEQINASHLSTALLPYATQTWVTQQIAASATGGTVTAVKVGTTTYNPSSGVVSLPDYLPLSGGTMSNTNLVTNLNADLLDGHDSTYFVNRGTTWDKTVRQDGYILELRAGTQSTSDNPFSIIGGNAATVIQNLPEAQDYGAQLAFGFGSARVVYRNRNNSSSNSDWVGIIAGSADKLVTSRTIWGQSFDGTANVSGNLSSVSGIEFSSSGHFKIDSYGNFNATANTDSYIWNVYRYDGSSALAVKASSGNVGIGTTSPSYKLDVNGDVHATNFRGNLVGNADSATKLQTARTIWGQSFDGSSNVDGKLTINSNLKGSDGCADYQTIYSEYTSSIGYSFGLKNVYNVAQTGYGVGLKLSLGTNDETQKWFGIAAVSTDAYANKMALTFNFNSTESVRITSDGDVGIGTNQPAYKLDVSGDVSATNFRGNLVGNANTATKLQTARTIWGQSFDGTANVSGNLSSVGNITGTAGINMITTGDSSEFRVKLNNVDAASYTFTKTFFGCFGAGADSIDLGRSFARWNVLYTNSVNASGSVSVGGTLSVTGATTLSSTLGVTGNTTLSGTLSVSKATTLSSTLGVTGAATLSSTLSVTSNTTVGGTLGVTGATTLSSTLVVSGNAKFSGYTGFGYDADTNYRVKVKGVVYASTGVYSAGYVTALSDIRHKDVQGNVRLTVREVANAPSVKFLWKDRRQEGMQVGSIAQYWKKVMPEAVVENADGELTMSYGVIALLASIATARKVEDLERRVVNLEKENKLLKKQLNAA